MKFFLDTANLDELKKGASWGIVDGVTTNPSLIAKEGRPVEEGRKLAEIHKNIVVKSPLTRDGIKATSGLDQFLKDYNKAFAEAPAAR